LNIKNQQIYFYIVLGLCLLLSGILFFWATLPSFRTWGALKKDLQRREKEVRLIDNIIQENKQLKEDIAKREKDYEDFNRMFFLRDDISQAVKTITDISQDLKIELMSLIPQPSQKLEAPASGNLAFSLWKTPISIKIKTDYLKLIDFIKGMEKSNKFIRLENLRIKKNPSSLLFHDVEMKIYVFSLQQEKS